MTLFAVDPQTDAVTSSPYGTNNQYFLRLETPGFRPPGSLVINGFQAGLNGDQLYLAGFLESVVPGTFWTSGPNDAFSNAYLRLIQSGPDTVIQFDPTGSGAWSDLVTLKGVDPYTLTWFNFIDLQPAALYQAINYAGIGMLGLPNVTGGDAAVQQAYPALVQLNSTTGVTLTGGAGHDVLVGGHGSDTFHGGAGSDRIFEGGGGVDTATYDGVFRSYQVQGSGGTVQVSGGPEAGTDTLSYIARAQFVDGYLATSPTDTAAQVYRLYAATLGRAPDPEGLANWTHALNSGSVTLQNVADGFVKSTEFQQTYGSLDNTGFVTLLYNNVLHRAPDAAGLADWVSALNYQGRGYVVIGFSESAEDVKDLAAPVQQGLWITDQNAAEVARLYDTVLGRLPDTSGLANWTHTLQSGTSLQTVADGFTGSTEFQTRYGSLDNTGFVSLLYQNVLHRAADSAGLNNWLNALNGGETRSQVVVGFSESAEHIANTAAHIDYGVWVA